MLSKFVNRTSVRNSLPICTLQEMPHVRYADLKENIYLRRITVNFIA